VNVDLWPKSAWSRKDLKGLTNLFKEDKSGKVTGQISEDIRGIEVMIGISFAMGAIAGGFFSRLGSDLYDQFRSRISKILLEKVAIKKYPSTQSRLRRLCFSYSDRDAMPVKVRYVCLYDSEQVLDVFFTSLASLDTAVQHMIHSQTYPFDDVYVTYDVFIELKMPQEEWDIRIQSPSPKNVRLHGGHLFRVSVPAKFSLQDWHDLEWEKKVLP